MISQFVYKNLKLTTETGLEVLLVNGVVVGVGGGLLGGEVVVVVVVLAVVLRGVVVVVVVVTVVVLLQYIKLLLTFVTVRTSSCSTISTPFL